tara:strand:- start:313 stop:1539 length:1227 start_codon:yes stop_codon:yes gene_type:complete
MRILIVNFSDDNGGAAIAATRLHESLLSVNIDSKMLVFEKFINEESIYQDNFFRAYIQKKVGKIEQYLLNNIYKNKTADRFSASLFSLSSLLNHIDKINPDIVHLHWVQSNMLSITDIVKINRPIVWSLHDMWAFTGGCHYNDLCERYIDNCGKCHVLGSLKDNDLSRRVYNSKLEAYYKVKQITLVGLSKWMQGAAIKSSLLKQHSVVNLPNPIDIEKINPKDRIVSRKQFNLDLKNKIILVGAVSTSIKRKGFKEFLEALSFVNSNVDVVVFGRSNEKIKNINRNIKYVGEINSIEKMIFLYSAADVMVVPSLQENLSNTIMESLACGTPVVAFNIGGNPDMIEHKVNGYLSTPFDVKDLSRGIDWVLTHRDVSLIRNNSINKVKNLFSYEIVSKQYKELYESILD